MFERRENGLRKRLFRERELRPAGNKFSGSKFNIPRKGPYGNRKGISLITSRSRLSIRRKRHCDLDTLRYGYGGINCKIGQTRAVWYLWFPRGAGLMTEQNDEYRHGIAVSWVNNNSPSASTYTFACVIQASFYGFGMAWALKRLLCELSSGDIRIVAPRSLRSER